MGWRTKPLPPDWGHIRLVALERDGYRCTWFPGGSVQGHDYKESYTHPYRCPNKATDVDHIDSNTNHSINNLRSLCKQHHSSKTSSFAHKSMKQRNNDVMRRYSGKSVKHPGIISN
nr:hypothetical protein GCM10025732_48160 [Glycomyces mayteni]